MRATLHSGRANSKGQVFKAKHNDRQFDFEKTSHIDFSKMENNDYVNVAQIFMYQFSNLPKNEKTKLLEMDFTQTEKFFYKTYFSGWLNLQNQKHEKSRHTERIKNMDEIYNNKRFCPDETIMQYGNMESPIDKETLMQCYQEYLAWHEEKFGENIKILNFALHDDELVPHIHERRVFFYKDENGNYAINQGKALEKFYELPEGTEKSRFNNLKQQYTAECREKWEEIGRSKGLYIQKDRLPPRKHQEKNEYIIAQQEKKIAELEQKSAEFDREIERKVNYLNTIDEKIEEMDSKLNRLEQALIGFEKHVEAQIASLFDLLEKYTGNAKDELTKAILKARENFSIKPRELKNDITERRSVLADLKAKKALIDREPAPKSVDRGEFVKKSYNMPIYYKNGQYHLYKGETLKKTGTLEQCTHEAFLIDKRNR